MGSCARRCWAWVTAVVWSAASVFFPVTVHAATYNAASNLTGRAWFVPATGTGLAGTAIVATGATMLARANPWIGAIAVGTQLMRWALERKAGGNIQVIPRDVVQPVNGDGWVNGVPPSQIPTTLVYTWGGSIPGSDPDLTTACLGRIASEYTAYRLLSVNVSGPSCNLQRISDGWLYSIVMQSSQGCVAGYTKSGTVCNLTNANLVVWPNDGVASVTPSTDGTTLVKHPRDADPLPAAPSIAEILNPTKDYAPDPFGNPASQTITPSATGFQVDQRVQTTTNGQTTTTINNFTVNNAGTVTNILTTTVPGPIELASPTAVPVTQGTSIQFPTDYNREATQQQAVQKLEDIKQGTGAAEAPNYQTDTNDKTSSMNQDIKDKADAIPGQYSGDKDHWFSWVWTPPIGSCSPWTSSIHGQAVVWDFCPWVAKIRDVLGYLLAVGSAVAVYGQLFKREE